MLQHCDERLQTQMPVLWNNMHDKIRNVHYGGKYAPFDFMLTLALVFVVFASFRRRYKKLKSFNSLSSSSSAQFRIQQISTDGFRDGLELLPENPIGAEYAVPPVSVEAGTEPGESAEEQSDSCQSQG